MMKKNFQPVCLNCVMDPEDNMCKGCARFKAAQLDREAAELRSFLAKFRQSLRGQVTGQ